MQHAELRFDINAQNHNKELNMKVKIGLLTLGLALVGMPGQAQEGPPLDLPITRDEVPSSGRCRVFIVEGMRIEETLDLGCSNIEKSSPLGSYIMMRSRKNLRIHTTATCGMSRQSDDGLFGTVSVGSLMRRAT